MKAPITSASATARWPIYIARSSILSWSASVACVSPMISPLGRATPVEIEFPSAERPILPELTMIAPEQLTRATFAHPSTIELEFVDGQRFSLAVDLLGIPIERINWPTLKASPSGEKVVVKGIKGGSVPIDSATLRYLVDAKYAARIDQSIRDLHIPIDEARSATADAAIDPRWADVDDDDLFE